MLVQLEAIEQSLGSLKQRLGAGSTVGEQELINVKVWAKGRAGEGLRTGSQDRVSGQGSGQGLRTGSQDRAQGRGSGQGITTISVAQCCINVQA